MDNNSFVCPSCGRKRYDILVLASCPCRYEFFCLNCLWGVRYYQRENSKKEFTQAELDSIYQNNKKGDK